MAYRRASNCLNITLKVFVSLVKETDERGDYSSSPWKVLHPHWVTHRTGAQGVLAGASGLAWNFPWALRAIWFYFPRWLQRLLELYPTCLVSQYSDSHVHILTSKLFFSHLPTSSFSLLNTHTHTLSFYDHLIRRETHTVAWALSWNLHPWHVEAYPSARWQKDGGFAFSSLVNLGLLHMSPL